MYPESIGCFVVGTSPKGAEIGILSGVVPLSFFHKLKTQISKGGVTATTILG